MIGRVDAVFVDYLLVRTSGLLPVDLYVPRPEVTVDGAEGLWRGWLGRRHTRPGIGRSSVRPMIDR